MSKAAPGHPGVHKCAIASTEFAPGTAPEAPWQLSKLQGGFLLAVSCVSVFAQYLDALSNR